MLSPSDCTVDEMKVLVDGTTELMMITDDLQVPKTESSMEDIVHNQHSSLIHCELCDKGFINETDLEQHIKTHETLEASEIVETDSDNNVDEDDNDNNDDGISIYVCEHCGRSFKSTIVLKRHQQQVHNTTPDDIKFYNCDTCEYTSSNKKSLQIHEKNHIQESSYIFNCDECGKGFYSRTTYEEHQLIHNDDKPFQCNLCPATFRYRQGLRLHAKLHQPDYIPPQKKHLCELCNKRFSRKQVLLVHMRTHSNAGPQNEYVCHICNKSVSSKTYLTVHVRKHTGEKPHVCDLCNKAFISQNYLSVHRRTHTGERPHKCTHCEKRFTQRTTLVVHLRGHTGDRPYPCTYCIKSFASKTMLNSHLKTHAKQNARTQQDILQNHDIITTNEQHLDDIHFDELQDDVIGQDELSEQSQARVLDNVLLQS